MAGKIDVNTPLIDVVTHVLTIRPNKQVRYTIPVEVARSGEAAAEEIKFIVWAGTDEPFQEARIGTAEQKNLGDYRAGPACWSLQRRTHEQIRYTVRVHVANARDSSSQESAYLLGRRLGIAQYKKKQAGFAAEHDCLTGRGGGSKGDVRCACYQVGGAIVVDIAGVCRRVCLVETK